MPPAPARQSLALRALVVATALLLPGPGCLVTDSSDFPDPVQTRPFLRASTSSPRLDQVLVVRHDTGKITFTVEVQSEDNGQKLLGRLVANWPDVNGLLVDTVEIGPGTFSDVRTISIDWDPTAPTWSSAEVLSPGCYPITLIVTHKFTDPTNRPARSDDADFVVWWVLMGDVGSKDDSALLGLRAVDCPSTVKLPSGAAGAGGG